MNGHARAVWQMLRKRQCRGIKFRREHPIPPYTADFCCIQIRLIVEVDGDHHYTDAGKRHDRHRDKFLFSRGYTVLRIPGYEVENDPRAVFQRIEQAIDRLLELIGE